MNKIYRILIVILGIIILTNNYVYGSFADYTDEDAEKDTQVLIKEHENNFDSTKSENNYLQSLWISDGVLSPDFDRQIAQYTVRVKNGINEIDIIANPEDERAKINGNGKIRINDISECKIEVSAESGTVRTYFIKIITEKEEDLNSININQVNDENELLKEDELSKNNLGLDDAVDEYYIDKEESPIKNESGSLEYIKNLVIGISLLTLIGITVIIIKSRRNRE